MKKFHYLKIQLLVLLLLFTSISRAQTDPFTMTQTLSDGAQRNTIAFDGLAFLTGNTCACSFIPPGKVADYFGFQYVRDNDITRMGHTTDFLTVLANNLLHVLTSNDRALLLQFARNQVSLIDQYGYSRLPLIDAFVRLRDRTYPAGSNGLIMDSVKAYSARIYELDGVISLQRARVYGTILRSISASGRHYLDSIKVLGMRNMPVLPDQIDKRGLTNREFVAVMSFASDLYAWYTGSLDADVYFCPERQGNYFGGFYIKDAPAMGNSGYSIDTALTQNGGIRFVQALNSQQAALITSLVDSQRVALLALVDRRTDISLLLRNALAGNSIDSARVIQLSRIYGELDGEISWYYATNFSKVGWSLTQAQKDTLHRLRNLDNYPCNGMYLYSENIGAASIPNSDFLFISKTSPVETTGSAVLYPNPNKGQFTIQLPQASTNYNCRVITLAGQTIRSFNTSYRNQIDLGSLPAAMYLIDFIHPDTKYVYREKIVITR